MNDHEQLDKILDAALSEYRGAEPLAGLEDRVLQRLRLQPERRLVSWSKWGAIAVCAALVLIVAWFGLGTRRGSTAPALQEQARQHEGQTPGAASGAGSRQPEIATRIAAMRATRTPSMRRSHPALSARVEPASTDQLKPLQFPTPAPLTPEEHALLALLKANPEILPDQRENWGDVAIAPLEIKPLAGSAAPTQENSNE
jgi:hypothetical protein